MLLETNIKKLIEYVALWNQVYSLDLMIYNQDEKYVVWTVGNLLITGIQIAPERVLIEFDNFDLQGANNKAREASRKIIQLLQQSFPVDNTKTASRVYGVMTRQAERFTRIIPAFSGYTSLDAETEAEFRVRMREKHPDITDKELNDLWIDFCERMEQQRAKKNEQERRRGLTADEAAKEWWGNRVLVKARSRIINLIEYKLRKVIRDKPSQESEVQDAFENLLVGADIFYKREKDRIEYSSKTYIPDFTFADELDLALDFKFCGTGKAEKRLIAEINNYIVAFQTKYTNCIFVVYDLGFIQDVELFTGSFEQHKNVTVRVVKH